MSTNTSILPTNYSEQETLRRSKSSRKKIHENRTLTQNTNTEQGEMRILTQFCIFFLL